MLQRCRSATGPDLRRKFVESGSIRLNVTLKMIGRRLKEARTQASMSQETLGEAAGILGGTARSRLSQYESERVRPPFELMCRFAELLDVPECYFYTRDDELAEEIIKIYRRKKKRKEKQ